VILIFRVPSVIGQAAIFPPRRTALAQIGYSNLTTNPSYLTLPKPSGLAKPIVQEQKVRIMPSTNNPMGFDDRNIRWRPLGELKHFVAYVYNVDMPRKIVDFIVKFEPNEIIVLHRHLADTNTLVIQGEHRIFKPDRSIKEIRPVGSYTSGIPEDPHYEGGGEEGCVVFYSMRTGEQGLLFELMDNDENVVAVLDLEAFRAVQNSQ